MCKPWANCATIVPRTTHRISWSLGSLSHVHGERRPPAYHVAIASRNVWSGPVTPVSCSMLMLENKLPSYNRKHSTLRAFFAGQPDCTAKWAPKDAADSRSARILEMIWLDILKRSQPKDPNASNKFWADSLCLAAWPAAKAPCTTPVSPIHVPRYRWW